MRAAVTICLIPEAAAGPFVFHGDLVESCRSAKAVGYDAVEIFLPNADASTTLQVKTIVADYGLAVSAFGSGGGWLLHKLTLTSADAAIRTQAKDYIRRTMHAAAELNAPVIIGSLQGRHDGTVTKEQALAWLAEALQELSEDAASLNQPIFFEPLNRYETNLLTTLADTAAFLDQHGLTQVKILADLFHMNIEEVSLPAAIRAAGGHIGHVHFADSNRLAMGLGHTAIEPIVQALRHVNYTGYLCAEVFPKPDAMRAATQTMTAIRHFTGAST